MDCLKDYIGLRGCSETAPPSGLYVNTLPGVPKELLDKIATSEQITYKQAWSDIQDLALQEMFVDIHNVLAGHFKIHSLLRSVDLLRDIDTASTTAAAVNERGWSCDLRKYLPDGYAWSNMVVFTLDSLRLYVPAGVYLSSIPIKIYDGDTKEVLFLTSVAEADINAGTLPAWFTVPINKVFTANKLVAVYDSGEVNSIQLTLPPYINDSLCGCLDAIYDECPGEIKGVISTGQNIDSLTEGTNTYGLTGVISISCSYQNLICTNKMLLGKAIQLLLGSKVLEAALYTDRFGRFNTLDAAKTEKRMADLYQDYISCLGIVLKGLQLDTTDPCVECDSPIQKRFVHP